MNRRQFLSAAAVAALGAGVPGLAGAQSSAPGKRLIVLFLKGGLDGLSALVPYDDPAYLRARPTIALPPPGREGGVIPLVQGFGLHPALEPLMDLWRRGVLAMIPACGLNTPIRTHPEAQQAMESGHPGEKHNQDGWLARLLPLIGKDATAITLSPRPPLIGQGKPGANNMKPTGYPPSVWPLERPDIFKGYDVAYKGTGPLSRAYGQAHIVLKNQFRELDREILVSASGAPSIEALPKLGPQIVSFMDKRPTERLSYAGLGGFDAHYEQGAAQGQLAKVFAALAKGLVATVEALGQNLSDTLVLVMSEFGRGLRENEYGGTDNGHGTLFMLLGGKVAGGSLHGPWPGLSHGQLSDGLDLKASVDYREVLAEIAFSHFGLDKGSTAHLLPAYVPSGNLSGLFKTY